MIGGASSRSSKSEVIEALRQTKSAVDDLGKQPQSSSDAMLPMVMMMMMRKKR